MPVTLEACPALVLNADFRPLSYFPLSLWPWQESVKAVVSGRVNVVSVYERVVHSPRWEIRLPSVISLKDYIPAARRPAFTRFNVFLRDRFSCQYCGETLPSHDLTFDHVVPRSRGGRTTWENVVTACAPCNLRKGNRMPDQCGMPPLVRPYRPSSWELQEHGRRFPPSYLHESWRDFLSYADMPPRTRHAPAKPMRNPVRRKAEDGFPRDMTSDDYWTIELDGE